MRVALDLRPLSIEEKSTRGIGTVVRALARSLAERRPDDVSFLALLADGQDPPAEAKEMEPMRLPWAYGDISRPFWRRERRRAGAFLRRLRPDVYHTPDLYTPRGYDGPVVVTVHDCFDIPLVGPLRLFDHDYPWHWNVRFRWRYRATWRALRRASRIVANSRTTAERVRALHPALAGLLETIPWGVEAFWLEPPADPAATLRALGLSGRPLVLHVGGFETRKNPAGVRGAFERLRRRHPSATLAIVGPPHGHVPEGPGVRSLGYLPREALRDLYATADCLLFPSFDEGYGLPVAEALACGCPVVVSRGTAAEEIGREGVWAVDPRDVEEIARAAHEAIEAGRRPSAATLRRFEETADEYLRLYRRVARAAR